MNNSITYQVNLQVVGQNIIGQVTAEINKMTQSTEKATKTFGDCFKSLLAVSQVADGLSVLERQFDNLIAPGVSLNSQMAELSAITGVTGQGLKEIEQAARATSKTFGTDASANVESYKLVLSQLDPEIAKNSEAMKLMGENINILSKQMGGNTVAATNVLTTSMNQFGVSTEDPIQAAKVMADMMNVMSSAAQAGSAELPQIQSALEQVGIVAKTTGLSFEATNAQIQILDKAGKKGSEGGVALRNVLTTLSEGRFTSKLAAEGLEQAGISVEYLADTSIPLTDRLRALRKIQDDTALMTKVFGKENMAAAIAMINGADESEQLAQQITGTKSAVEQANIIMGSYSEKMARAKAWTDNLKIGFFNLIKPLAPVSKGFFTTANTMGQMAVSGNAVTTAFKGLTTESFRNGLVTKWNNQRKIIGIALNKVYAKTLKGIRSAFFQATLGATAFQIALDALGIGLILLAIAGLIAGIKYLWENSQRFREILFGVGHAAKAVFQNIGIFLGRLWNLIIKPIITIWWRLFSGLWLGIWNVAKGVVTGIGSFFSWLWNSVIAPVVNWIWEAISGVFLTIWETVTWVFTAIADTISVVWNWLLDLLGGFGTWINEVILKPLFDAFGRLWDWIVSLFGNIKSKLTGIFKPILDLINQLFSKEGMSDIKVAYQEGEKAGAESFQKDKKEKEETQKVELVENPFDFGGKKTTTKTLGGAAVKATEKSTGVGTTDKSESNKVRNLTIGKFMDNFNVYMNGSNGIDKYQLQREVREIFLTASADFVGAE